MEAPAAPALLAAGVTANVAGQAAHGDGGLDLRPGLRHLPAGARSGCDWRTIRDENADLAAARHFRLDERQPRAGWWQACRDWPFARQRG